MWNWIQNLWLRTFGAYFDFWEFFAGMFFGVLGAWIYVKFEPIRNALIDYISRRTEASDRRQTQASTDRYRLDLIQYAQLVGPASASHPR